MTTEDKMTVDERYKYLRKMKSRYDHAGRKEQGHLLDEMEEVTGLHRKSLIRLMKESPQRKRRARQRGRTYGLEVDAAIGVLAASLDYPCAERLTPNLGWLAEHLAAHQELEVSEALLEQLKQISVSTVERRLRTMRPHQARRPRKLPRAPSAALWGVPMGRIPWDTERPGHLEADTVHHCGDSATGEYVHTVQFVDVATGWAERWATLGRGYTVMEDAFRNIMKRLPFRIRELHADNGSEFFNSHLRRFWGEVVKDVRLSRSRPYHKNDNPLVEQRNANPVRAYLGYERYDTVAQTQAINELYDQMRLYHNLFQPVMHVVEKKVFCEEGQPTRIRRRYDAARPPLDRLRATGVLSAETEAQLLALRQRTNPRHLLADIATKLDRLFSLPGRTPEHAEVVYDTLSEVPDPRLEREPVR
jgi:hypothetical protein